MNVHYDSYIKILLPGAEKLCGMIEALEAENVGMACALLAEAFPKEEMTHRVYYLATSHFMCLVAARLLASKHVGRMLEEMKALDFPMKFMPLFEAMKAHHLGDRRYLGNIPFEAQPCAELLFDRIGEQASLHTNGKEKA